MDGTDDRPAWRRLTPGQRAMLRRLAREGPLLAIRPWEMRTIRSLLDRGLVRPRERRDQPGLWFLSPKGSRILPERGEGEAQERGRDGATARGAP